MNYIKHIPLALLTLFCLKYLVISATYADIALLVVLAGASCFFEFHLFSKEFREFKAAFDKQKQEYNETVKELHDLKSALNSVKIGQSLRGQKVG